MSALSQYVTLTYETTSCITCGVVIALPSDFHRQRRIDHKDYYCPNGHGQRYTGDSLEEQLRKQLAAEMKKREWAEQAQKQAELGEQVAIRSAAAYKGKLKRVANGVCPCCKRSFTNLRRHMATKHPAPTSRDEE